MSNSEILKKAKELVELLEKQEKSGKVGLFELKPGDIFQTTGKRKYKVLEQYTEHTKIISLGFVKENVKFDDGTNDYSKSSLKNLCDTEILKDFEEEFGEESIETDVADLITVDGQKIGDSGNNETTNDSRYHGRRKMNSAVLKRKFTGKPATMPYSAAKIERMQRMFDESREKVLAARNEEIEKAYQKGKEDGINRTVSVLNKVVENAREEEREKSYNAGFEQGFTDGQDWANVENSVTLLLALHRAYDFEPEQLMNVVEKSNKYVHQANEGKPTIGTLARQLYNECQIKLCEHEVEILRKYSLFEEGDPYD